MSNLLKKIENFDLIKKLYSSKQERDDSYGELTLKGVESLSDFISRKSKTNRIDITNQIFLDIGSGYGRLLLHLSLINDFNKFFGVEIEKDKYEFSKELKSSLGNLNNVIFVNDDVKNLDLYKVDWIFMNDVVFNNNDVKYIFENIKPGTHIISFNDINIEPDDFLNLDCDWVPDLGVKFSYYHISERLTNIKVK